MTNNERVSNDLDDLIYLPNGELNSPFVLANANILLKENEFKLAAKLFLLMANQRTYAFCGYFGLAKCFEKLSKPTQASESYKRAFELSRRPYIAFAYLECLLANHHYHQAEQFALMCAVEFVKHADEGERFRRFHRDALEMQMNRDAVL